MSIKKSSSFPEGLNEATQREFLYQQNTILSQKDALNQFREKDHDRTEQYARMGSSSSILMDKPPNCVHRCCNLFIRWGNYMLERGENERKMEQSIRQKSYAGFYYFLKWFVRSLFLLVFTTMGSVAGKEVACEIQDHSTCNITAVNLAGNSPHILATIIGSIFGLLSGQWLGRFAWDHTTRKIMTCLRLIEKLADRTKAGLIFVSIMVYAFGIASFGTIFFFFVKIGHADNNIIGGLVGGGIGLVCFAIAYHRNSTCRTGEETPMILVLDPPNIPDLPELPPNLIV